MTENKKKENPWSSTVILPKTDFPMKAGLATREPEQIKKWQDEKIFTRMKEARKGRKEFLLHDGPPYANGHFHTGHALNKILKDIIVKSKYFNGHLADMTPGWDCHGLPIEVQVLKNLGKKARETEAPELRKLCREYAEKFVGIQGEDLSRFLCFWEKDNRYLTMDKGYEARIVEVFGELYKKGYIYKGKKPVYWDITLATSHAEAEIEYQPHTSPSIYVKFAVEGMDNLGCLIWTTTPWTLPANLAICFNKKIEYGIYDSEIGNIIIADGLKESIENTTGKKLTKVKPVGHDELEKMKFVHPFIDRLSVPLFGDHVTLEAGTGCVHTAPGHGADDYRVGIAAGLETLSPVNDYGKYTNEFPLMEGKNVFAANPEIIELLKEKKALFYNTEIEHSYPHSWRSKKPLIFRATPQWFFSMEHDGLRDKALAEIDNVNWIPEWGYNRIKSMAAGRPDWCLSRQRNWGVPIPAFACRDCGETYINQKSIEFFTDLVREKGIEIWYTESPDKLLPADAKCQCGSSNFRQETDILDVWFDSGVSSFAVIGDKAPADLYLEGSDQHRGWFQSSLWPSVAMRGKAPYKGVLTHGYVLDDKGHAMSKSLGNVINPTTDIINVYGADILRLWVSSQDFRDDIKVGQENLKIISEQYRKIRNTFRYLLGNLDGHKALDNLPVDKMDKIDRYYLSRLAAFSEEIKNGYDNYNFHQVYHKLVLFATVDLSQNYFEIIRDRMYCEKRNSRERLSSSTVLYHILENLCILTAPVLSFTAEEVWGSFQENSVFLQEWRDLSSFRDIELEKEFAGAFELKEVVQKALEDARQKGNIGKLLEAAVWLEGNMVKWPKEELEMFLVVSQVNEGKPEAVLAENSRENLKVYVAKPENHQCPRCWRHTREIKTEGDLCGRCAEAVNA